MAAVLLSYEPMGKSHDPHVWTPKDTAKLGASLLSRLTEAADGHRNGKEAWLVGELMRQHKRGHTIKGPYDNAQLAFEANRSLFDVANPTKDTYKIFGPFITTEDFGTKQRHVERVTLHLKGGGTFCLDGAKYDCVFWSVSAVDKFVVPYYVHITNLEEAEEVRDRFMHPLAVAAIHIPGSEIIDDANATAAGGTGNDGSSGPAGATPGTGVCTGAVVPEGADFVGLGIMEWVPRVGEHLVITPG